ncbi:hypothetical protein [Paraburkholderia heleia]|uniref:hypothetical protein n=1 Tax=Paraburkholderia heleia TaxID=634127 RepID=UPI0031CF2696
MMEKPYSVSSDINEHKMLRALVEEGVRSAMPFAPFVARFHGWRVTVQQHASHCVTSLVISIRGPDEGLWQWMQNCAHDAGCGRVELWR